MKFPIPGDRNYTYDPDAVQPSRNPEPMTPDSVIADFFGPRTAEEQALYPRYESTRYGASMLRVVIEFQLMRQWFGTAGIFGRTDIRLFGDKWVLVPADVTVLE